MQKYASAQIMTTTLVPKGLEGRELKRFAHRHHFDYDVRPGYLYVRSRAISSRCNDNFDEFPAEELEKAYATFKGKPVFVNHVNDDHKRARGVIIDAALHKDANRDGSKDYWVEVLMEVDALRFPRLAKEILAGNIARTSMGCDVSFSKCSACGNKATSPAEYCQHIPASKGMTLYRTTAAGHKVGEIIRETCFGLKFFENSLLVEPPADPTAHFLGVDTRGLAATASKDPRFQGVGLKEDDEGHYVTTHRARSKSYPTPEAIPQSEVDRIESTGARKEAAPQAEGLSWDQIGERHPHVYGDPEVHGEAAEHSDGWGIGDAANHLAFNRKADPETEGSSVHELTFHKASIPLDSVDHQHHSADDGRVQHAERGYRSGANVPPLVVVHRHGVFQVADGHHRAQGAKNAGLTHVDAYVAKSPYANSSFGDGEKGPYHGAEKTRWSPPRAPKASAPEAPSQNPSWTQERLFEARRKNLTDLFSEGAQQYPNPGDHPWFKDTGIHHKNIVDHWNDSTPEEKAQGKRWYPDAHLVAKQIAKLHPGITDEKEAAHKGGGVLSAYSPQQNWWANQHNAARSFHEQRALGKGEGLFIMGSHQKAAQRIMDGEDHQKVLKGPKTADFAHLIEHGGYKPQSDEDAKAGKEREHSDKVVVDRHALSVAAGKRLNADDVKGFPSQNRHYYEHVAGEYRKAAAVISDREGREVPPHEVQAVTWLTRQRKNKDEEISTPSGKGRQTMQQNQRKQWQELSKEHTPGLHEAEPPNSHVTGDPEPKTASVTIDLTDAAKRLLNFTAYGEQKAPMDVDTLREDSCPVCSDRDTFDGSTCEVCGYVAPPKMFQDPDLELARQMDLRKDVAEFNDPSNPNQIGPDGNPLGDPTDPENLGAEGTPPMDPNADPSQMPGGLPGEVQAEVQPADGAPMDPTQMGMDGQIPDEAGAPVDPSMIGPDGQPMPQGQQMLGPDGMPIGPQPLPADATSTMGQPFTPGPNMPEGPGEPEGPEGPQGLDDLDEDGQPQDPDAGQGTPGTPADGVPDLLCPACGFTADAAQPTSVDMDTQTLPNAGTAQMDGTQAGDICPACGSAQLMSPAQVQGGTSMPMPV